MIVVVEPTMRVQGVGSINIEDTTVVTEDGTRSAHFEHTVAITANGTLILTANPADMSA